MEMEAAELAAAREGGDLIREVVFVFISSLGYEFF